MSFQEKVDRPDVLVYCWHREFRIHCRSWHRITQADSSSLIFTSVSRRHQKKNRFQHRGRLNQSRNHWSRFRRYGRPWRQEDYERAECRQFSNSNWKSDDNLCSPQCESKFQICTSWHKNQRANQEGILGSIWCIPGSDSEKIRPSEKADRKIYQQLRVFRWGWDVQLWRLLFLAERSCFLKQSHRFSRRKACNWRIKCLFKSWRIYWLSSGGWHSVFQQAGLVCLDGQE